MAEEKSEDYGNVSLADPESLPSQVPTWETNARQAADKSSAGALLAGAGAVLILVAAVMLSWEEITNFFNRFGTHPTEQIAMLLLYVGLLVVVGGIAMLMAGADSEDSQSPTEHFTFKLLNKRFEKDLEKLDQLMGQWGRKLPLQVQELYANKEKELQAERGEQLKVQDAALAQQVSLDDCGSLEQLSNSKRALHRTVFVIMLDVDMAAKSVELLSQMITLLVQICTPQDEVVIVLENPGGSVTGHGLGASQLERLRKAGIRSTVCVDQVAASGGYMMACVANKIVAAPFAMVGSIGVVAMIPNFQRLLKDNGVDPYLVTAGEHKRTIDVIGEVTPESEQKLKAELAQIHEAFKNHVAEYRPQVDMATVGTGEAWLAVDALSLGLGLVDELATSDEYLGQLAKSANVVLLEEKKDEPDWLLSKLVPNALAMIKHGGCKTLQLFRDATTQPLQYLAQKRPW